MTHEQQVVIINQVLDTLRPMILRDGGNIEFVKIENKSVYVRLQGACIGCPSSFFTLKMGIEQAIKEKLPDIEQVLPIE